MHFNISRASNSLRAVLLKYEIITPHLPVSVLLLPVTLITFAIVFILLAVYQLTRIKLDKGRYLLIRDLSVPQHLKIKDSISIS